mmetsp:Transcript_1224/g.5428  ORF Transcript_1224/g.5428 Transcript_1224/m.5428 type:complete len:242 (+) Transcript_1224:163-888(+)
MEHDQDGHARDASGAVHRARLRGVRVEERRRRRGVRDRRRREGTRVAVLRVQPRGRGATRGDDQVVLQRVHVHARVPRQRGRFLGHASQGRGRRGDAGLPRPALRRPRGGLPRRESHTVHGDETFNVANHLGRLRARRDSRGGDHVLVAPEAPDLPDAVARHFLSAGRRDEQRDRAVPLQARGRRHLRRRRRVSNRRVGDGSPVLHPGGVRRDRDGAHVQGGVPREHTPAERAAVRVRGCR